MSIYGKSRNARFSWMNCFTCELSLLCLLSSHTYRWQPFFPFTKCQNPKFKRINDNTILLDEKWKFRLFSVIYVCIFINLSQWSFSLWLNFHETIVEYNKICQFNRHNQVKQVISEVNFSEYIYHIEWDGK